MIAGCLETNAVYFCMGEEFSELIWSTQKAANPQGKKKKKQVNNNSQINVNNLIISALMQNPKPVHLCYFIAYCQILGCPQLRVFESSLFINLKRYMIGYTQVISITQQFSAVVLRIAYATVAYGQSNR